MSFDARAVANFLLDYAEFRHRPITHLSLQKILFFCHGWYLAKFDQPLIAEPVEAWAHGPVYRSVYKCFRAARKEYIKIRAEKTDFSTGRSEIVTADFDTQTRKFVQDIFDLYSQYKASDLRRLSHADGSPWHTIWTKAETRPVAGMRIPDEVTRTYYKTSTHSLLRQ